jgi:hypothetical protein
MLLQSLPLLLLTYDSSQAPVGSPRDGLALDRILTLRTWNVVINRLKDLHVRELLDIMLAQAACIASESNELSADDLIRAARFYLVGEIPRLKSRKTNAWNLFLSMKKGSIPEELRGQTDGVSYETSRPGLNAEYSSFMKKRWETEPEIRKKYERITECATASAVENNNRAGNGDDGGQDVEPDQEHRDVDRMLAA